MKTRMTPAPTGFPQRGANHRPFEDCGFSGVGMSSDKPLHPTAPRAFRRCPERDMSKQ